MSKKNSVLDFKIRNNFELSENHKNLVQTVADRANKLIFVNGPAGTAKTYCTVLAALQLLERKSFKSILYLRSIAECADKSIGSLPGELADKIAPFGQPFLEKLNELISQAIINQISEAGMIDVQPLNFLRGTTFHDKIVIVDEAQNITIDQLYIIISRLGEHGKIVLLGDCDQIDIKDKKGYETVFKTFDAPDCAAVGIKCIRLTEDDIKRSKLLRFIMGKLKEAKAAVKGNN
jgi:phosphate starvation-inducible PhoH-like protein